MKSKETIALNPVVRPKNNQQFMARRLPYWKTAEYKKAMLERREEKVLMSLSNMQRKITSPQFKKLADVGQNMKNVGSAKNGSM